MTGKFFCARCGYLLFEEVTGSQSFVATEHLPCPSCGSSSVRADLTVAEKMSFFDQMSMKAKDAAGATFVEMKSGGSLSADGTVAQIEQVVDRRARTYKKKVTLADGTVVKDVEGSLEDQGLHGPQAKNG
jgi:ribosomal protein S27AE